MHLLGKDTENVAFGQVIVQASDKDVCRVLVVIVPAAVILTIASEILQFPLVDLFDFPHHIHGGKKK